MGGASSVMTDPVQYSINDGDDPAGKSDEALADKGSSASAGAGDLTPEQINVARRKARINAAVLIAVLLLVSLAPYPWNVFAPLLFLVPLIAAISNRLRLGIAPLDALSTSASAEKQASPAEEPYSCIPKDPKDPRKYKPIG
jgi:hypothetical protein